MQLPRLRRRRTDQSQATVAAATRISLDQPKRAMSQAGKRQPWQEEAWGYFDTVPEVKQGTWQMGNQIAKVRLVVATMPADGDEPILARDATSGISPGLAMLAELELGRLRSSLGGQPEILRELSMNIDIAGECYVVGWGPIDPQLGPAGEVIKEGRDEDWDVRSISEVEVKGSGDTAKYVVKDSPGDKGRELDPETDTIIRVWQRHPRWSALADSMMAGVRGECEALITLHAEVLADSRSRHNMGVFTLPNELSFGAPPDEGDDTNDDAAADPLTDEFQEIWSEPVDDPQAPGAVAPGLLRGPGDWLKPDHVRWVETGRAPNEFLDKRIQARIERLARGLNWPVETTMGHQSTTFANAAQVDEDEFADFHEPRLVLICDALSMAFLRPQLIDAGQNPAEVERLFVWYDPTALIKSVDKTQDAKDAHGALVISDEALRNYLGFGDEDAPQTLELLIRTGLKRGIFTADLSLALLELAGVNIEVDPIPKAPALPAEGDTTSSEAAAVAQAMAAAADPTLRGVLEAHPEFAARLALRQLARGATDVIPTTAATPMRPGRRIDGLGRRLMDLDTMLRAKMLVLADRTMDRALEKAGNKLRSNVTFRPLLRGVDSRLAGAHLGGALIADAGITTEQLLADAMEPMREQFMAWGAAAQADAIEYVSAGIGGLDAARRAELGLRQARGLEEAWGWLRDALTAHAERALLDPSALAPSALGELPDAINVPPGLVREAMSIAGGGVVTPAGTDAWVAISPDQYRGGIGTGDDVMGLLRDEGYGVEGYQWVAGHPARPFAPHQELDGVTFTDWSDPVLANTGSFPDAAYFIPGDHGGCQCDVAPVIIATDGSTTIDV